MVRSTQVGRRLKNVHIRPKHRGVGLEHDEGESADVGDQSDQDGVRRNDAQVESDVVGVESDVVMFESTTFGVVSDDFGVESAPSGFEPDGAEVGPNIVLVRPKPSGGGPKHFGVESDEVGIQSADSRVPSRASRGRLSLSLLRFETAVLPHRYRGIPHGYVNDEKARGQRHAPRVRGSSPAAAVARCPARDPYQSSSRGRGAPGASTRSRTRASLGNGAHGGNGLHRAVHPAASALHTGGGDDCQLAAWSTIPRLRTLRFAPAVALEGVASWNDSH